MGILEKLRLDGKNAYVTGGARGIGKAIACALSEAGANVAVIDTDFLEAEKTARWLRAGGNGAVAIRADVTDAEDAERMVREAVQAFGSLDIAVNNAGICHNEPAEEMSLTWWNRVISVNLTGVFLSAQASGRQMIRQGTGGAILNTASMSAHIVNTPQPQCAYNASKAGVVQLTKSLAVEWCRDGIRVNCISPGYIGTELTRNSPTLSPLVEQWEAASPLGRIGRPEELQAVAVYLASGAATFTTGADFVVDGAFTCV